MGWLLPISLLAWLRFFHGYCHCSFIERMCLKAVAWALLQAPGEAEMIPTWPCSQNSHLQRSVNSHLLCRMTKPPESSIQGRLNKSTCGGRCQGGLQRKSVPWILVSPRGLKPQVKSREPISFDAEGKSGELLQRHLEGQWGLNNGWLAGPGNNWGFIPTDLLVIIFFWYLF